MHVCALNRIIIVPSSSRIIVMSSHAALGFEVTDVQTIGTEPTSHLYTILTTNQIIGVRVGGGLGLILILVLIIVITW